MTALTPEAITREYRELVKNKAYRAFPMGGEAGHYLRWKRGRLTDESYRDYESCLDKMARFFMDLEIGDFEPPVGTERLEEFLEHQWGAREPRTYNKNLSILRDFFKWATLKDKLHGDPTLPMQRRKPRGVHREVFNANQIAAIVGSQDSLRDRIAVRLLLIYGLRKGALGRIQFKHFDHQRRWLTIFTKGQKVRQVPIPDPDFWLELERLILERGALSEEGSGLGGRTRVLPSGAINPMPADPSSESASEPHHYLMCRRKSVFWKYEEDVPLSRLIEYPDKPMGAHGLHDWWYECLERAGLVPRGTTSGERMHKARHTAGQRLLDKTSGNLKAVQALLGHADIGTTGNVYTDWDIYALENVMRESLEDE